MLNKILNQLEQLSKDELLTLNSAVIKIAKAKSRVESIAKSNPYFGFVKTNFFSLGYILDSFVNCSNAGPANPNLCSICA